MPLERLASLGIDTTTIPSHLKDSLYEVCNHTGLSLTMHIGFLLDEDNLEEIRELNEHIPATRLITSKPELFKLREETGDKHVGFTHLNHGFGDEVFFVLYSLPAQFAWKILKDSP